MGPYSWFAARARQMAEPRPTRKSNLPDEQRWHGPSIKGGGREHGTRHKQADRERYQLPALSNFVGFLETRVHSANALDIVMMAGP